MPTYSELLDAYANAPAQPNPVQQRRTSVAIAAEEKQAELETLMPADLSYQIAAANATGRTAPHGQNEEQRQIAHDLQTLNPVQMYLKYGTDAQRMIATQNQAGRDYRADRTAQRSGQEATRDIAVDVGTGLYNLAGGIVNLGVGLASDEGGANVAEFMDDSNAWIEGNLQSDGLAARRRASRAAGQLDREASDRLYEYEQGLDGDRLAGLNRIVRGASDAISNATEDRTIFASGGAQAIGSLLGIGPVTKILQKVGAGVLSTVSKGAVSLGAAGSTGAGRAFTIAERIGRASAVPAAIGLTEAGGSYQQTVNEVMGMSHDELMANSPAYSAMIAEGTDRQEAKTIIAGEAGREAALMQGVAGAAAGTLVSRFEAAPLAGATRGNLVSNIFRETVEESIQGASGAAATNLAIQRNADDTRTLSENVGEAIGEGGLYGSLAAGVLQGPSTAVRSSMRAAGVVAQAGVAGARKVAAVGEPLWRNLVTRGEAIVAEAQKASPTSVEQTRERLDEAVAAAPEMDAAVRRAIQETESDDTEKQDGLGYLDRLTGALQLSEDELADPELPDAIRSVLTESADRFDAVQRLTELVAAAEEGSNEQLTMAVGLYATLAPIKDVLNNPDAGVLGQLPADSQANQLLTNYEMALNSIQQNDQVRGVLDTIDKMFAGAQESGQLAPVEEAEISTPEGQQRVRNTLAVSELSPLNANPEANDKILFHYDNGKIPLAPHQVASLRASSALVRAQRERFDELARLGLTTNNDIISEDVLVDDTGENGSRLSMAGHIKRIVAAARAGDKTMTAALLFDMAQFAQHMQNKVQALNEHLAIGDGNKTSGVRYDALQLLTRDFDQSLIKLWVNPNAPDSVKNAQAIGSDAATVVALTNELIKIFPETKVKPVKPVELDPQLTLGTAEEVGKAWAANRMQRRADARKKAAEAVAKREAAPLEPVAEPVPAMTAEQIQAMIDKRAAEIASEMVTAEFARRDAEAAAKVEAEAEPVVEPTEEVAPEPVDPGQPEGGDQSTEVESVAETAENVPETAPEPVAEPVVVETAMSRLLPISKFRNAFKLPANPKSRLTGMSDALAEIKKAFLSMEGLERMLGGQLKYEFTDAMADAYADYLADGDQLKAALVERMKASLLLKRGGKTIGEIIQGNLTVTSLPDKKTGKVTTYNAENVLSYAERKALNLLEEREGELEYNDELLEHAILAALQWRLTAAKAMSKKEEKDAAKIAGVSEDAVNWAFLDKINEGMTLTEASRSLAQAISSYWGMTANQTAPDGIVYGIPEAMAKELLRVMIRNGSISVQRVALRDYFPAINPDEDVENTTSSEEDITVKDNEDLVDTKKVIFILTPTKLDEKNVINSFSDVIDQVVLVDHVQPVYIGEAPTTPVAEKQLRNTQVDLTQKQKDAIAFERTVEHYNNSPLWGFYGMMGLDAVLDWHGQGDIENMKLNAEHRKSLEGKNKTLSSAFYSARELITRIQAYAEKASVAVDQMPVFYDYVFTRVNRMQMLGTDNPQASKFVRELILPTRSTIDLSSESGADFSRFGLALAQALGVKVHKMLREDSTTEVLNSLNGTHTKEGKPNYTKTVELLRGWLNDQGVALTPAQLSLIKQELGGKMSPVAVHALMEYARYLNTNDRANFTTSLYVEADGITNGPVNAMVMLTPGVFTEEWLLAVNRGGLNISSDGLTMNQYNSQGNSKDNYEAITDELKNQVADSMPSIRENAAVHNQFKALAMVMDLFLPDVELNKDEMEFMRGIAKNPSTITIYGSGARGIANKITGEVVEAVYARMSLAMQRYNAGLESGDKITLAQAMFPNAISREHAAEQYQDLTEALNNLTSQVALRSKRGKFFMADDAKGTKDHDFNDWANFKFTKNELDNFQRNMLALFVTPMRAAITRTFGEALIGEQGSARLVSKGVQVQSIVMEMLYKQAVEAAIAEKRKDPNWRADDFLSRAEQDAIFQKLLPFASLIETDSQGYYIAGSESSNIDSKPFGMTLDGKLATPAFIRAPADAGVAGTPGITIGFGDGLMMLLMSAIQNAVKGTLKVYDGIHLPLDQLELGSQQANQAVWETWMGNPIAALEGSYATFLEALESVDLSAMSDLTNQALTRSLGLGQFTKKGETPSMSDPAVIKDAIKLLGYNLKNASLEVEARHLTLAEFPISVDQMASVGAPYQNVGTISIEGLTREQILEKMKEVYLEKLATLRENQRQANEGDAVTEAVVEAAPIKPASELEGIGRLYKNGVRELSFTALKKLARKMTMTPDQKAVLSDIMRTMITKDYRIVVGSMEQLRAYAAERGTALPSGMEAGVVHGWMNAEEKTIYMVNPTSETLVHELIHAATIDKVTAYYNGENLGPNHAEQAAAIKRIEAMMDQFLELDTSSESAEVQNTQLNVINEIDGYLSRGNKAAALNEFMAWGLANAGLSKVLAKTQVNPLVQLARNVVAAIKSLIWGRKQMPKVGTDMLSNLRFNSTLLFQIKLDFRTAYQSTNLYMREGYGTDERLVRMERVLDEKVIRHLKQTSEFPAGEAQDKSVNVRKTAIKFLSDIHLSVILNGFPMSDQEQTTFRALVNVMATDIQLDGNAISAIQDMYAHVTKTLKVEDFMTDPASQDPSDRYYAQQKYDVIVGNYQVDTDKQDRSSLVPVFLGLAVVNPEFRAVLAKMALPKTEKKSDKTLDAKLENMAVWLMDRLQLKVSGQGTKATNVQAAINNLVDQLMEVAQDRESKIAQLVAPLGNVIAGANKATINAIQTGSEYAFKKAGEIKDNSDNKLVQQLASLTRAVAGILNENNVGVIQEGILSATNRGNLWQGFQDTVSDLVGRTDSNAQVYDMIKLVRAWVQQKRQQFRDVLPQTIASKFTRKVTSDERTAMFTGMGMTDLAAVRYGQQSLTEEQLIEMLQDPTKAGSRIGELESQIQKIDPKNWNLLKRKMQQLAHYMTTREPGTNLLSNADAVAHLLNEGVTGRAEPTPEMVELVDQLVSLYAFDMLPQSTKNTLSSLVQSEAVGVKFVLAQLMGSRVDEMAKARSGKARFNHYKGHMIDEGQSGVSLIVMSDKHHKDLIQKSYVRLANYAGSNIEGSSRVMRSYYFSSVGPKSGFNQGIFQTVRRSAYGVDPISGFSNGLTAGRITDPTTVARIAKRMKNENATETLLPVFDGSGRLVAFERSVDPKMLLRLEKETDISKVLGIWKGRQLEEIEAQNVNIMLIDRLKAMYDADLKLNASKQEEYVDLFDPEILKDDPVLADAVGLLTGEIRSRVVQVFGGPQFWVRRNMIKDAVGYRAPSVSDAWTGNSRWDANKLSEARKIAIGIFGLEAYKYMVNAEKLLQNAITDARVMIVVKSVVVPMANLVANVGQLWVRGVPIVDIARTMPKKAGEIQSYIKSRLRMYEAAAELEAAMSGRDIRLETKLKAEIQSIQDDHKRLSIWPLIEAGEFSSISDGTLSHEDMTLAEGKLNQYIEKMVDKLPDNVKTFGRYAVISRDTALFKGLQRTVEYGDFLAKAVLYDHLTKREGKTKEDALGRITDEFVNYDRLPGRARGYLESIGAIWFWNFKIRTTKVGLSMMRNNPLHALLAIGVPDLMGLENPGLPVSDNILALTVDGTIDYSVGPGMAFRAPGMLPWF